ncbi:hypothetical protein N2152v2_002838 [Parachlorella kessleri]
MTAIADGIKGGLHPDLYQRRAAADPQPRSAGFATPDIYTSSDEEVNEVPASKAAGRVTVSRLKSTPADPLSKNGTASGEAKLRQLARDSPFFELGTPIDRYELVKLVVMLPVVLLKFLLLIPIIVLAWVVLQLLLIGHVKQTPMHPLRGRLVGAWVKGGARLVLFFSGYYHIGCKGWQNMRLAQESRSILVFNHESYVDAAAMAAFFAPSGVAKSGVASIPFIGRFAVALQFFFIERKGTHDKSNRFVLKRDPIQSIKERAADRRYPLVMMAPEATTKPKRCLLKFRRGAFAAGAPVAPVVITYRFQHFNPGWGIVYTPLHVYRLLAQYVNHMELRVLPPIHPTPEEREDPMLFAKRVRQVMSKEMGAPLVEQGVSDERELMTNGVTPNLWGTDVIIPSRKSNGLRAEE